jgi:hypothetical protein
MQNNHDLNQIVDTVELYFTGTYEANAEKLKQAFHADAHITGFIKNEYFDWNLTSFIKRVTSGSSAKTQGEKYDKEIILLDKTNDVAMVKARVQVGPLSFTDYITLLKINRVWTIRNKSFIA